MKRIYLKPEIEVVTISMQMLVTSDRMDFKGKTDPEDDDEEDDEVDDFGNLL